MSSTKRKGWIKREWAKFPLGSIVKFALESPLDMRTMLLAGTGAKGIVVGYGQSKQTPVLVIELTTDVQKGNIFYPIGTRIKGQPLSWWERVI